MADEPENEDLDLEVETESAAEWFEVEGGYIVAPRGWQDVQDHFGSPLVRVNMKAPGTVDVLVSDDDGESWKWRNVEKLKVPADIRSIRGDKS
jgi:hypothetical protein